MRSLLVTILTALIAAGSAIALTVYQSEVRWIDGEEKRIVVWVYKNKVLQTPVFERCATVGPMFALMGAILGCRFTRWHAVHAAVVGALVLAWLSTLMTFDAFMTDAIARENTQQVMLFFAAWLGALLGAEASHRVSEKKTRDEHNY